jgi:hypothetical protein
MSAPMMTSTWAVMVARVNVVCSPVKNKHKASPQRAGDDRRPCLSPSSFVRLIQGRWELASRLREDDRKRCCRGRAAWHVSTNHGVCFGSVDVSNTSQPQPRRPLDTTFSMQGNSIFQTNVTMPCTPANLKPICTVQRLDASS